MRKKTFIIVAIIFHSWLLFSQIPGSPNASGTITPGPPDWVTGTSTGDGELKLQLQYVYGKIWGNVDTVNNNTFYGNEAGEENIAGEENTAFGSESLKNNTYGTRNTTVGALSMEDRINGNYNVAVGYESQSSAKFNSYNTSIGYKSLNLNTVGDRNVALGYKTLENLNCTSGAITVIEDNGDGKTKITSAGHGRSNGNTVEIRGTGIWDSHSFSDNYDGTYVVEQVTTNTFVIDIAYIDPSNLVDLGFWKVQFEATNNLAIGYASGDALITGIGNILIGYQVDAPATSSNSMLNIGNLIKGFFSFGEEKWVALEGSLRLVSQAADPTAPVEGETYFNSTDKHFYGYNGTVWVQLDN